MASVGSAAHLEPLEFLSQAHVACSRLEAYAAQPSGSPLVALFRSSIGQFALQIRPLVDDARPHEPANFDSGSLSLAFSDQLRTIKSLLLEAEEVLGCCKRSEQYEEDGAVTAVFTELLVKQGSEFVPASRHRQVKLTRHLQSLIRQHARFLIQDALGVRWGSPPGCPPEPGSV